MTDYYLPPAEIAAFARETALKKARIKPASLLLPAVLGGAYIALGGMFATVAAAGTLGVLPFGLVKILMGIVFSLGLVLVVVAGAELFTGNTLLTSALAEKKITWRVFVANLGVVYVGNLAGSLIMAGLVFLSGHYQSGQGAVGKAMFAIAVGKLHYDFWQVLVLGVLCNILVCLAIWLSYSAKQTTGKILAIAFPVTAFIALGFEHCVANMYLVPVAGLVKFFNPAFAASAGTDLASLTIGHFLIGNLLPATIGNLVGGSFVWLAYSRIYRD